jgi:hypothetical protein
MKTLTEKQVFWKRHLEAAESFDGTLADYARAHDLSTKKLYGYKTRIRQREAAATETSSGFARVMSQTVASLSPVTVTLPNGVRLTLSDIDAPGLLERLAEL